MKPNITTRPIEAYAMLTGTEIVHRANRERSGREARYILEVKGCTHAVYSTSYEKALVKAEKQHKEKCRGSNEDN